MTKNTSTKKALGYHYTACGLDNVYLQGLDTFTGDDAEDTFIIPNINLLHRSIAASIATAEGRMTAQEVRYLRTWLGHTQEELADLLDVTRATVNRWETAKSDIPAPVDALVRVMVQEACDEKLSVSELMEKARLLIADKSHLIDGSDPKNYSPVAA